MTANMTANMTDTEAETYIEIRGVYDGWSIAKTADGKLRNRWSPHTDPIRHTATQAVIEAMLTGAHDDGH